MNKTQTALRLKSEFNDLKRTSASVADETKFPLEKINKILSGKFTVNLLFEFLEVFSKTYPVDISDLIIEKKDTVNGILFYPRNISKKNTRFFKRLNSKKKFSEYYEYRDTAKSHLSFFYPEWIAQTRHVKDSNPNNPDVIYNHGHFLHQLNLFVGPVNFYYEIKNKKYCIEMNTGDSSYISPYIKHSFTSRDKNQKAYIVAVTTGSNLKRNQKEIRKFGSSFLQKSFSDLKKSDNFIFSIIKKSLKNEFINEEKFKILLGKQLSKKIYENKSIEKLTVKELLKISEILKIPVGELLGEDDRDNPVVNKFISKSNFDYFPSEQKKKFKIFRLASSNKYKDLKGFIIEVLSKSNKSFIQFSTNLYLINFSSQPVELKWIFDKKIYTKKIMPDDSIYIEPYVEFTFNKLNGNPMLYLVSCETCMDSKLLREMSVISEPLRFINDAKQWFDGK